MAQVFLEIALWEQCRAASARIPRVVVTGDTLILPDAWRGGFDLVVSNPPYGKLRLGPPERQRFARSLYGHANLYGIFTDLAVRFARPGGLIGYVTPASFLGGQYFKKLRGLLRRLAPPLVIELVTDRTGVFDRVLQEAVLVVLGRGHGLASVAVRSIRPPALDATCELTDLGIVSLPRELEAPWVLPRSTSDRVLLRAAERLPSRLRDYGVEVSTGPVVWNRHKPQLTAQREPNAYPLIWAESVLPDGYFQFRATQRDHKPYFQYRSNQEHLLVRRSVVLVQRTTAKEQQRRLVAALLPDSFLHEYGAVAIENHLNMIRPCSNGPLVSLAAIAALLNSDVVDSLFRCVSGSVAVSAYELELHDLDTLIQRGGTMAEVNAFVSFAYLNTPVAAGAA
jgi:adenine-specific DNA-methyltransferase